MSYRIERTVTLRSDVPLQRLISKIMDIMCRKDRDSIVQIMIAAGENSNSLYIDGEYIYVNEGVLENEEKKH